MQTIFFKFIKCMTDLYLLLFFSLFQCVSFYLSNFIKAETDAMILKGQMSLKAIFDSDFFRRQWNKVIDKIKY